MASVKIEKLPNGTRNLRITDDEGSGEYILALSGVGVSNGITTTVFETTIADFVLDGGEPRAAEAVLTDRSLPVGSLLIGGTVEIVEALAAAGVQPGFTFSVKYRDHAGSILNSDDVITDYTAHLLPAGGAGFLSTGNDGELYMRIIADTSFAAELTLPGGKFRIRFFTIS